jgi:formylglycine-generating enzyme required for sulfatase activity
MADETTARRSPDPPARGMSQPASETECWHGARTDMPAQLGRYRVKKRLGGGGMGAVYLVENTELQRDEALKVPHFESGNDPAVRERFLREARAAARLHHPNLCPIYHADVIDGIYFLTMCYLEGKLLSAYTGRPHAPRDAVKLVVRLAQALEYAHGKGVIHRDLKPANIMLCPGTGPTVMDFGLAKQTLQPDKKLTQTGMAMGTPAYMPPEQVKGDLEHIGPASDVYSLGVIFFELLTGRLPFQGSATEVMANVILTAAPLPSQLLPGLSPALDAVCGRAMAKAPEKRYPSMRDFAVALQELMATLPVKVESGARAAPPDGKKIENIFDVPTVPPEPPPVPKRAAESKRRAASSDTIPEALPEAKKRKPGRQLRASAERGSAASRRVSFVVWLCLGLLLGGAAVFAVFLLSDGRDRGTNKNTGAGDGPGGEMGAKGPAAAFTNDIDIHLVSIPGGKFTMGSPKGEEGHTDDEIEHRVEVSSFHLGIHEVTQRQFKDVMGYNPSYFSKDGTGKPGATYLVQPAGGKDKVPAHTSAFPVENVSWEEAKEFCEKLTEREKTKLGGRMYRLPREAEWEYSCRGGAASSEPFHFGKSLSGKQANFDSNNPYGGAEKVDPLNRTCKVGTYPANRFGLHDMHGNVWEWCLDWYDKVYYGKSPPQDPPGPLEGSGGRVIRGGSWGRNGQDCRSAFRGRSTPAYRNDHLGFRVALVPSGK